ncbi:SIS domain-containing protein [Alkalihalobacillus sp. TS-13]|uniref:KpsF/GutQ family sugar-phosphate isomerase n=1 Tax=Alkalihalobacillus sp. TS-13 TaxID=2842455 RepID=UPI001C866FBE|nr:SIS domain-containing protein [Alkalihalobacillus sp. TS-13]
MEEILHLAKNALRVESEASAQLIDQLDINFCKAIRLILNCKGKVVVTGVGKSGHIGKKITASLSSLGTPSFFVHSTEGVHGDLGMISKEDIVIEISNSGETGEVIALHHTLTKIGVKRIAITRNPDSTLAKQCDVAICYSYETEADHLGVAPTTSALLTLMIGDAMAITLSHLKQFDKRDFALYHPGGNLGEQLTKEN